MKERSPGIIRIKYLSDPWYFFSIYSLHFFLLFYYKGVSVLTKDIVTKSSPASWPRSYHDLPLLPVLKYQGRILISLSWTGTHPGLISGLRVLVL